MKYFKTIDEQYLLLIDRGIKFNEEEKAKQYLLRNNYYNMFNCYGKFFITSHDHYIQGTNFDEIIYVYEFDKELKSVLFKYILEVERHLKSLVAYYFSEARKNQNFAYLIATNFQDNNILKVARLTSALSNIISKYQNEQYSNSIKHYSKKYNDIPLWILINYMSLGQVVLFFKLMKHSEQNKVAKGFSKFLAENLNISVVKLQSKELITILDNVVEVRNIVAHNNQLLNFKCRNNTPYLDSLHKKYSLLPNNPRQDIYNMYIIFQCLLDKHQFTSLHDSIKEKIYNLSNKLSTISCDKILNSLGFPPNWWECEV